uniref:Amine oxidase domain-containing protein n=1 Tax=Chromera velia CCMP2878 TaxID=1169474 RepID=A0A0G4I1D3_9ALVE|mmetsp:Transcript_2710/g.5594  ORF Transcript_2710/g.5594 Transcript_2710/m.5594 type:complete len:721 (+) Transcript_2710:34-2196(+)|eukprot:Cvel_10123.t1-p1 / transcript=Cvel_10123.t1 / gene=Cvel_10123 / organism=Chromera_velia_CCMP2878 / gene_product=Putative all-trans-retinol 13,14-reductase, putative / transcript_product=Putative all-trans-retinol 13,14-reductase, putative / location=Cvel_scaffold603:57026-60800(-) / protein_length=720 / sequence_SO=supercontig / SO=protein_coding / is_pseudo=false
MGPSSRGTRCGGGVVSLVLCCSLFAVFGSSFLLRHGTLHSPSAPFPRLSRGWLRTEGKGWLTVSASRETLKEDTPVQPVKKHRDGVRRPFKKEEIPEDVDYVIVGSGIGGLWVAAALAKLKGYKCVVLEQHYLAGGYQHSFVRKGKYEFPPGLHYIANLEVCLPLLQAVSDPEAFKELSFERSGNVTVADEALVRETGTPVSHEVFVGNDSVPIRVCEGRARVEAELVRHFPREREAIRRFLEIVEEAKWLPGMFMTFKAFSPPVQRLLVNLVPGCQHYMRHARLSAEEALEDLTKDQMLRTVLSAFGGDLGEALRDGSFVMQAAVLGHVMEGCYFPRTGPMAFVRCVVPTIENVGGAVFTKARVDKILVEEKPASLVSKVLHPGKELDARAVGVRMEDGTEIRAKRGVISDAGMGVTLSELLQPEIVGRHLSHTQEVVKRHSGGISHALAFIGLNGTNAALGLKSSSLYYIPTASNRSRFVDESGEVEASLIQDWYRDTLLDPSVPSVSAGMVFPSAKDPHTTEERFPGKSSALLFSEARPEEFLPMVLEKRGKKGFVEKTEAYKEAKELVGKKMLRAFLDHFPDLEDKIELFEVGTPLTSLHYVNRAETLGLRHTPARMTDLELRPDTPVEGLFFTGQDVAFAGWAGAMVGATVCAQRVLQYSVVDLLTGNTLLKGLGQGQHEAEMKKKVLAVVAEATMRANGAGGRIGQTTAPPLPA